MIHISNISLPLILAAGMNFINWHGAYSLYPHATLIGLSLAPMVEGIPKTRRAQKFWAEEIQTVTNELAKVEEYKHALFTLGEERRVGDRLCVSVLFDTKWYLDRGIRWDASHAYVSQNLMPLNGWKLSRSQWGVDRLSFCKVQSLWLSKTYTASSSKYQSAVHAKIKELTERMKASKNLMWVPVQ